MTEIIFAKNLATGDIIHFPHFGTRVVIYITKWDILSATYLLSDGKRHKFEHNRKLKVEPAGARAAVAQAGEVERLDSESNRVSLTLPVNLSEMRDINALSFSYLNVAVTGTLAAIVRKELERGATLFTEKAIYRMPEGVAAAEKRAA